MTTRHKILGEGSHDFILQTLRRIGGSVGVNYCCHDEQDGGIQEVQTVFVSCPRKVWIGEFGEPRNLHQYFDAVHGLSFWIWEHRLPEGSVWCIGHIFERTPGNEWVVVKQIRISQTAQKCGRP